MAEEVTTTETSNVATYIKSENIKVYPTPNRGQVYVDTSTDLGDFYDPEAKYNTEAQISNILKTYSEKFVISTADEFKQNIEETLLDGSLKLILGGHYFEITNIKDLNLNSSENWFACIKVGNSLTSISTNNTEIEGKYLQYINNTSEVASSETTEANITLDKENTFYGLVLENVEPDASSTTYTEWLQVWDGTNKIIPVKSRTKINSNEIWFNSNLIPDTPKKYNIGNSENYWHNLYLSQDLYTKNIVISNKIKGDLTPYNDNEYDLGSDEKNWTDLHLKGKININNGQIISSGDDGDFYLTKTYTSNDKESIINYFGIKNNHFKTSTKGLNMEFTDGLIYSKNELKIKASNCRIWTTNQIDLVPDYKSEVTSYSKMDKIKIGGMEKVEINTEEECILSYHKGSEGIYSYVPFAISKDGDMYYKGDKVDGKIFYMFEKPDGTYNISFSDENLNFQNTPTIDKVNIATINDTVYYRNTFYFIYNSSILARVIYISKEKLEDTFTPDILKSLTSVQYEKIKKILINNASGPISAYNNYGLSSYEPSSNSQYYIGWFYEEEDDEGSECSYYCYLYIKNIQTNELYKKAVWKYYTGSSASGNYELQTDFNVEVKSEKIE